MPILTAGENVTLTINVGADTLTIAVPTETFRDLMAAFILGGTGITATHDDTANTLVIAATGPDLEAVYDAIGAVVIAGTGVTKVIDDTANTVTLAVDPEGVRAILAATIVPGVGVTAVVDDEADTITISAPSNLSAEDVDDRVNALIIAGAGISKTYDDEDNTLTLASTAAAAVVTANAVFPEIATAQFVDIVIDFDYEIVGVTVLADASGSAVFNVSRATYAAFPTFTDIDASAPPTLSAAQKSQDTTLTGWSVAGAPGDVIRITVASVATITAATVALALERV